MTPSGTYDAVGEPEVRILCFDPGEHTGWCCATVHEGGAVTLFGGTVDKNHKHVAQLMKCIVPHIVVIESFHLYPGLAKTLSWNSFYPCETIGAIKVMCMLNDIPFYEQAPTIKKYSGGLQADWKLNRGNYDAYVAQTGLAKSIGDEGITNHSQDAYYHWKYFERNTWPKIKNKYMEVAHA